MLNVNAIFQGQNEGDVARPLGDMYQLSAESVSWSQQAPGDDALGVPYTEIVASTAM